MAAITWATSDAGVASVTPAADGATAVVNFLKAGSVDISATKGSITNKQHFTVTQPKSAPQDATVSVADPTVVTEAQKE